MKIQYDAERRMFHLQSGEMSYVLGFTQDGRLLHLYWGKRLSQDISLYPFYTRFISMRCTRIKSQ